MTSSSLSRLEANGIPSRRVDFYLKIKSTRLCSSNLPRVRSRNGDTRKFRARTLVANLRAIYTLQSPIVYIVFCAANRVTIRVRRYRRRQRRRRRQPRRCTTSATELVFPAGGFSLRTIQPDCECLLKKREQTRARKQLPLRLPFFLLHPSPHLRLSSFTCFSFSPRLSFFISPLIPASLL